MKKVKILLLLAIFVIFVVPTCLVQEVSPPRPNVIIITIDALRPHHLSCCGYFQNTSPNIDKLAGEGALFKNAITQSPWSLPSITSIMTGLYPTTHKVVMDKRKLGTSVKPLAQVLREHGYATGAFTGISGFCGAFYHNRGFDIYEDSSKPAPLLNQAAIQWIESVKHRNFFAFIHYFDVHSDYNPPPPYDTMYDSNYEGSFNGNTETLNRIFKKEITPAQRDIEHIVALYDGGIRYTDEYLGKLLGHIEALGLKNNTLIILSADHGEEFLEHGMTVHRQLYDETIKVPLIMRLPDRIPSSKIITGQVRLIDIMPTILEVLGITIDQKMQGVSLTDIINDEGKGGYLALCETEKYGRWRALRTDDGWKLMHCLKTKTFELYNLKEDPKETNNLIKKEAEKAKELRQKLFEQMKKNKNFLKVTSEKVEPSPELIEKLKSLGYIQ